MSCGGGGGVGAAAGPGCAVVLRAGEDMAGPATFFSFDDPFLASAADAASSESMLTATRSPRSG
jgi:hypothetical protein